MVNKILNLIEKLLKYFVNKNSSGLCKIIGIRKLFICIISLQFINYSKIYKLFLNTNLILTEI